MSQGPIPAGMAGAASNPSTDAETLREIAYHFPELRPAVAANPATYPGLLTWLGELGDPAVNQALAARGTVPSPLPGSTPPAYMPGSTETTATWAGNAGTPAPGDAGAPWGAPPSGTQFIADGLDHSVQPREDATRGTSTGLRALLVVLLVIAVVLLTLVVLIFNGVFDSGSEDASGGAAAPSPTASEGTGTDASPSPSASKTSTPSSSPSAVAYPAPAGAVQTTAFTSPSGNIACTLDADLVTCTIFASDHAAKGYGTCGDTTTLTADASSSGLGCGTKVADGSGPLPYGSAATSGTVACVSTEDGVTCWNTTSGRSFAMARGGWMTGKTGEIAPQDFSW